MAASASESSSRRLFSPASGDAAARPGPLWIPRLPAPAYIVYALVLGAALGLWSAHLATGRGYPFGRVAIGPWTALPRLGSREVDPYARAVMARSGEIPLGVGEGLALAAGRDSAGRPLDGRCTYRIGSVTPQARAWTLTLYDETGRPRPTEAGRSGFTSAEVLRDVEGRFTVVVSPDARPGNWLPSNPAGSFSLALRLYDTPVSAGTAALDPSVFPSIERESCPS